MLEIGFLLRGEEGRGGEEEEEEEEDDEEEEEEEEEDVVVDLLLSLLTWWSSLLLLLLWLFEINGTSIAMSWWSAIVAVVVVVVAVDNVVVWLWCVVLVEWYTSLLLSWMEAEENVRSLFFVFNGCIAISSVEEWWLLLWLLLFFDFSNSLFDRVEQVIANTAIQQPLNNSEGVLVEESIE